MDRRSEAIALSSLAVALSAMGEREEAWQMARRAVVCAQQMGSVSLQAQAQQVAGMIASAAGAYEAAIDSWVAAISLFEEMGDSANLGLALFNLGGMMVRLSDREEALGCWLRSLVVFGEMGHEARMQTVVAALRGLRQEVEAYLLFEPGIDGQENTVWNEALSRLQQEYGCDVVEWVAEQLGEENVD